HYDYWSDKVRRSVLLDSKADILLYGNAERALAEIAHRVAAGATLDSLHDIRGTAFISPGLPEDWQEIDSSSLDQPGPVEPIPDPYSAETPAQAGDAPAQSGCATAAAKSVAETATSTVKVLRFQGRNARHPRSKSAVRLPAYEQVKNDPVLYAHASRVLHLETNPGNARVLLQQHGNRDVWLNPPPLPLSTAEMDQLFDLPFQRVPHPAYGDARIPAYEMIRFSVNIMRGCFGGCSFCSITEHEGRIIQSRSEDSIIREIEDIRDRTPGFTGVVSDLGGPTANMYRLACKSKEIEQSCRRLSCVYPGICKNLNTDHSPLIKLYRRARALPGIKKVLIASGLRYDLAVKDTAYVKELVTHHVGGYLKIAPEHTEQGPLSKMMKPGMGAYDDFKRLFDKYSREAGKEQYLIPYFIAAHPGTTDADMLNLALWLKQNGFRADQVQAFLPGPMALATAMYHSGRNPLKSIRRSSGEAVASAKGLRQRRLHKAFLRYHDPANWPLLRETLKNMGRADLIGNGKRHLIPTYQPAGTGSGGGEGKRYGRKHKGQVLLTQHTGLPPDATGRRLKRGKAALNKQRNP
ncbi:MAG: YgiQ family radical SAM protein, partial [Candidatus Competibacteraceae bacterium]|nr:YgiQ family radical SAM protein [Candidatus Competibacteraceae bacterium]